MGKVVTHFDNSAGTHTAKSPGIYQLPSYRIKQAPEDHSEPLSPAVVNTLQQLVGNVLYYTRAIAPTYMPKPTNSAPNNNLQQKAYCQKHKAYSNMHALTVTPNLFLQI